MGAGCRIDLLQGGVPLDAPLGPLEIAQGAARHPCLGTLLMRLLRLPGRAWDEACQVVLQRSRRTPSMLQAQSRLCTAPVLESGLAVQQRPAGAAVQALLRRQLLLAQPGRMPLLLLLLLLLCAARAAVERTACMTHPIPSPLARRKIGGQQATRCSRISSLQYTVHNSSSVLKC